MVLNESQAADDESEELDDYTLVYSTDRSERRFQFLVCLTLGLFATAI